MTKQCPICNANHIVALGAVAYSTHVVVEHRCMSCGHVFYLDDRRGLRDAVYFSDTLNENTQS